MTDTVSGGNWAVHHFSGRVSRDLYDLVVGERPVCCDFGTHCMLETGMTTRMKKAEWWDE